MKKRSLLVAAAVLSVCLPAPAHADESNVWPVMSLHAGVPYYFSFYGRSPAEGESTLYFAGHLGGQATWPVWTLFRAGLSADFGYVSGDISGVDGYVYSITAGPTISVDSGYWTGDAVRLGFSVTPAVLFYGAIADENLQKHSTAVGVSKELSVRFGLTDRWGVGVFAGLGLFGPPLSEGTWFNEPLGKTNAGHVSLGVAFQP